MNFPHGELDFGHGYEIRALQQQQSMTRVSETDAAEQEASRLAAPADHPELRFEPTTPTK